MCKVQAIYVNAHFLVDVDKNIMSSFHCAFVSVLLLSKHIFAHSLTMGDELNWYVYRMICGNHGCGQAVICTLKKRWVLLPPCLCVHDMFTHLFSLHVESTSTHQWIVLWHFNCLEDCLICSVEHLVSSSPVAATAPPFCRHPTMAGSLAVIQMYKCATAHKCFQCWPNIWVKEVCDPTHVFDQSLPLWLKCSCKIVGIYYSASSCALFSELPPLVGLPYKLSTVIAKALKCIKHLLTVLNTTRAFLDCMWDGRRFNLQSFLSGSNSIGRTVKK